MQLTNGYGFLCGNLPENALNWVNQRKPLSIAIKIIIAFVLAYVFAVITFLKLVAAFIMILLHIWSK